MGFNQQALYCYGKVHSLDSSNLNALWDRASLAKEIGDNRTVCTPLYFSSPGTESNQGKKFALSFVETSPT
jgi:hypothetical protein